MSNRIVFFGNERLATGTTTDLPVIKGLVAAGYDIAMIVIAQSDDSKSRKSRSLEIAVYAQEHNISLIAPAKLSEAQEQLNDLQAEVGVLVAYGKIVPQSIIDLFPNGIINIHPSLLPKHRGSIPLESVILNGESETGISLMSLVAAMDAGPIFAQAKLSLSSDESKQELHDRIGSIGRDMLLEHLPGIIDGSLSPQVQDEAYATYDKRIDKANGSLTIADWGQSTEQLLRKLRAYAGWPRLRCTIGALDVTITAAHADQGNGAPGSLYLQGKQLGIHTGDGIFIIDSLIPAGKKEMPASAFLAGYHP